MDAFSDLVCNVLHNAMQKRGGGETASGSISFAKRAFFHPLGNNVHSILSGDKKLYLFYE